MNTLTTVLTIMTLLVVTVFVIRYIRGRGDNTPTPTPVTPTPSPTLNLRRMDAALITLDRATPLSMTVEPSGKITTAPFSNGVVSGLAVNDLEPLLGGSPSDYHYRIINLSTNNVPDFSVPLTNADVSMTEGATFKLISTGNVGDAYLACDMVIYENSTNNPVVSVSMFINVIANRV